MHAIDSLWQDHAMALVEDNPDDLDVLREIIPAYTANDIRAILDERVIGQESAKESLSHLLAMHFSWFMSPDPLHPVPNALLIGPTGVGKTHTIETAADKLQIPLAIVDSARLAPTSLAGEMSFEDVFDDLIASAERLISGKTAMTKVTPQDLARRGIVFIDEFDKLRIGPGSLGLQSNFVLQRTLLQILEGAPVQLSGAEQRSDSSSSNMDTRGILFIASGAFEGIREQSIRAARPQQVTRQGVRADAIIPSDIHNFGFLPELIARLPVVIQYEEMTVDNLVKILDNPVIDPTVVYKRYLRTLNVGLNLTPSTKRYVAEQAFLLNMGARGLHQVLFPILSALSRRAIDSPPGDLDLDERAARRLLNESQ